MISDNFTKYFLENVPLPLKGRTYIQDTKVSGLALYITNTGCRTFFVRKRVKGRDQKLIIGRYPHVSIENARKQALNFLGQIACGKDPLEEQRKEMQDNLTFGDQVHEYMERHSKMEKKSWKTDERTFRKYLSCWFGRKLSNIRKEEVQLLVEKVRKENGKYEANRVIEKVRHLYNKADEWGWQGINPAKGVKKYKTKSRDRFILPGELPFFQRALKEEEHEGWKDFFCLLLLCGTRKSNMLKMRFDQVDFEWGVWRIPDTKNGDPLVLPLVERALEILRKRRQLTNSPWVFPSPLDSSKSITDPRLAWHKILLRATIYFWESNPHFAPLVFQALYKVNMYDEPLTAYDEIKLIAKAQAIELPLGLMDLRIHDIRRTLGSYQAISGSSLQIIGNSLGHKSPQSTLIYARLNLEPVKASVQKATDLIFAY